MKAFIDRSNTAVSKWLRSAHLFIHNYHQPIRGTLLVLVVGLIVFMLITQADEFAQQSREREQATAELTRVTNQQTVILCTFIMSDSVDEDEQDQVRAICKDEIDQFDFDPSN